MGPLVQTPANGVSFLHIPDDRFTTARITVSLYVPLCEETAGLYAVLPYLLRRGTRSFPTMTAFNRELDRLYATGISAFVASAGETQIVNVTAGFLNDAYTLGGEPMAAQCAKLLLDVLFDPPLENDTFRSADVQQEIRCTLESIAAEINDKRTYAVGQCKRLLCKGEPYAVSKYGTKERVEALTPDALLAGWKTLLATAPVRVIYQGNGDAEAVKDAITARLGAREVATLPPVVTADAKPAVARENETMDVNQCQLVLGLRTAVMGDHELIDAMRLANAIFGGTPHSFLFRHVREEHSLCYYCVSRYDRSKGVMMIESGVEEASLEKAETEILHQLERLKNGEFNDEEFENAKLSVIDSLGSVEDSASSTAQWYLSQGCERARAPHEVAEAIRAVTREQVVEAAKLLTLDCVYTLTPEKKEETA